MRALVTGGAGFIGSHLCDYLIDKGWNVTILDNISSGATPYTPPLIKRSKNIRFLKGDCRDPNHIVKALKNVEVVFHFAANPEVRLKLCSPSACFQQNIYATQVLLEKIKDLHTISTIIFSSTSTVYGEPIDIPTPENYGPLKPISLYGASKLACEALLSGYAHTYNKKAIILRLANIVGSRSQHGVIFDFVNKLKENPKQLKILGDGSQTKSYLHVIDCIEGIATALETAQAHVEIFNIGSNDQISVTKIAQIILKEMKKDHIKYVFTGGVDDGRGWKGDVKNMLLDTSKLKSRGWEPKYNSAQAIEKAVKQLLS
jgi:UDP-glucose 4-epimerase